MPPRRSTSRRPPDWRGLMQMASGQSGFFTSLDAAEHGVTAQTLRYRIETGVITRELRGVYRFTAAPPTHQDELIALWLWSGREGVFSHVTALSLYGLSDAMPSRIHMTLPRQGRYSRTSKPRHVTLHFGALPDASKQWIEHVPVTAPLRTIQDCIEAHGAPDLIDQSVSEARHRGLITLAQARRLRPPRRRPSP